MARTRRTAAAAKRRTVSGRVSSTPTTKTTPRAESSAKVSRAVEGGSARLRARMGIDYSTALAIQESRAGRDERLLPYQPTPSINPPRPRTLKAGYDENTQTLRVRFRDGTPWEYYDVPLTVWQNFTKTNSPGRFINSTLNNFAYGKGNF